MVELCRSARCPPRMASRLSTSPGSLPIAQKSPKILNSSPALRLAEIWRAKPLQYTWLHSLTGRHVDFWQLTGEALDFALDTLKLPNGQLRKHLLGLYLRLDAYPEVENTLMRLKAGGLKCAILSNGSPAMLSASIENAGVADLLDAVLSVEQVKVYKPHPTVYGVA